MELITSQNNKYIKYLTKLSSLKFSKEEKAFITYDEDVIKLAKKLGLLKYVFLTSKSSEFIEAILITSELMEKLNKNKSNIIGVISYIKETPIKEDRIIYLDEIKDPSNLSKIIYLMKKHNYNRLILSTNSVSVYNLKCLEELKTLIFDIKITIGDFALLKSLKKDGYYIYSTGLKSSIYLHELGEINYHHILVFGNEARGVSNNILDISDKVIKIKIQNLDSLNIAVSMSIILDTLTLK